MADIALAWNITTQTGDWSIAEGQVVTGCDLQTSALISLFTDQVLPSDQIPVDGSNDPRGWWGDTYTGDPIGSQLWTLSRAVKTNQTALLATAKSFCVNALEWMITDGVAISVEVSTAWIAVNQIGILIVITEPSTNKTTLKTSISTGST